MGIPFKSLSFDPRQELWGCDFGGGISSLGEEIAWISRSRSYSAIILASATGLQCMDHGMRKT